MLHSIPVEKSPRRMFDWHDNRNCIQCGIQHDAILAMPCARIFLNSINVNWCECRCTGGIHWVESSLLNHDFVCLPCASNTNTVGNHYAS